MRIERNQIRAIKGSKAIYRDYHFHAEILVNGKWIEPYLVNEEKLNWYNTNEILYIASDKPVKEFLERQFKEINYCLANGYELVSYEKYKEVIHKYHYSDEYVPNTIYLD